MYKNKKILAIIPARGDSKGLVGKNIKELYGKPLIAWTIQQVKKSRYVDRCIISSDSKAIIEVAQRQGGDAPFVRPKKFATDTAQMIDYVLHAIEWFRANKEPYDIVVVLQPTSPLRAPEHIDQAVELLFTKKAKSIVSVCETDHPPLWSNTLPKNRCMAGFLKPAILNKPRQSLPIFYRLNGALYVSYTDYLIKKKTFFTVKTFAYIMPLEASIDIDTGLDFKIAEALMRSSLFPLSRRFC